jgi:hypothetical protein
MPLCRPHSLLIHALMALGLLTTAAAQSRSLEAERQKAVNKQQFQQNFRNIQVSSQGLLRDHENGKLTVHQLNKSARSINRSSKTLRSLMALGELAEEPEPFEKELQGGASFDRAIRKLHQLIYDFAHSPVHQNTKVFNTKLAAKAQTQLLTIIELSKILVDRARDYTTGPTIQGSVR